MKKSVSAFELSRIKGMRPGAVATLLVLAVSSCGQLGGSGNNYGPNECLSVQQLPAPGAPECSSQNSCPALGGSPWVPQVSGVSPSNHDPAASTVVTDITESGVPITGLAQAAPASREVTVTIDMSEDLGANGSLTLQASVRNFPSTLSGSAYPMLVYLSDGTNDLINLARAGLPGDCASTGYYVCAGSSCTPNPGCSINWPSAYYDRAHWEQHQVTNENSPVTCASYPSVNTFPTCNWSGGQAPGNGPADPACAFNTTFFDNALSPPRLRSGAVYTAKYVLLSSDFATVEGYSADLDVQVIKKADPNTTPGGGVDLNVFLVGSQNVQASRTPQGQRNLDTLFSAVYGYFSQSNVGVRLGAIHPVEWGCDQCGDAYSNIDISLLGQLFSNGSALAPAGTEGQAINVFLVSSLPDSQMGNNLTILGLSAGIGGPVTGETPNSGVAVSTFNELASFNPTCATDPCPLSQQEADFWDMGVTIAHEMGHYLGLNHPSESDGTVHDVVADTPVCTTIDPNSSFPYISNESCALYDSNVYVPTGRTCQQACPGYSPGSGVLCPAAIECQFNHIMWWTSKNFDEGTGSGDGTLFSPQSGRIIDYNPYIL